MSYTFGKRVNLISQTTNQKGGEMSKNQGVQFGNDVGLYEGEYKDGKYHGQGTLILSDGQGTLTIANGTKFEGEWKDDRKRSRNIHLS